MSASKVQRPARRVKISPVSKEQHKALAQWHAVNAALRAALVSGVLSKGGVA